jgi:anti-sigma regulatory factor (Ser/Thr protein kinase)
MATPSLPKGEGMTAIYRETFNIQGGDFTRAGSAASRVKQILKEIGLDNQYIKRAVIIAYEAEINVVCYAYEGEMTLTVTPTQVEILVEDKGPGIEDIELAMQEGYSTASDWIREMGFGAGMGLPNIKKNSDSFEIHSTVNVGTRVHARVLINDSMGRDDTH